MSADPSQGTAKGHPIEARGFAAPPAGRRTTWALVVPQCPFCGHLHLHRAKGKHSGLRVGSCGRMYQIILAGQRRRAA